MTSEITIVMPCHNRCEALRLSLESLTQQTYPAGGFEVVVVDQASTDGSRELVRSINTPYTLHLIEQDAKRGPSVGRNAGITAVNSRGVLLLDADMVADPDVVSSHVACQAGHPGALICGRVLPYRPAYVSYVEEVANPDVGLDRGDAEGQLPYYQAFGGHLSFAADTFRRIGPFDPDLKSFEDIDFAYRASRQGVPIVNCPRAVAYHNHPRTLRERSKQARTYSQMLPILLDRYPEMRGTIPGLRDFEPVHPRLDDAAQILRKLRVRLYGVSPMRWLFLRGLAMLNRLKVLPRVAKATYWRLHLGDSYVGFREGVALLRAGGSGTVVLGA